MSWSKNHHQVGIQQYIKNIYHWGEGWRVWGGGVVADDCRAAVGQADRWLIAFQQPSSKKPYILLANVALGRRAPQIRQYPSKILLSLSIGTPRLPRKLSGVIHSNLWL